LVEFRILGPVELWSDDRRYDVGRAQERCVLAILLDTPGQPVSVEKLVDHVWDGDPPPRARNNLHSSISRLRARLKELNSEATIDTFRSGGYVLQADKLAIDLHRFRERRLQARSIAESGDDERAIDLLGEAFAEWRGEPLANVRVGWATRARERLHSEFFAATLDRIEIELRLGRHADLVGELSDLITRHPFDEKLVAHLMMAQYRCGRQADALKVYRDARQRLKEQVGTDPEPELQELHQRILQRDRTLLPVPRRQPLDAAPPSTLPLDLRTFVGRDDEVAEVLEMASLTTEAPPTVIAIDGMAGIGKTVFAVHIAHRLAPEYPDGQLYVDLHAYDAHQEAIDPATALDMLLRMLGIPSRRIPRSLADRTALWRAELARRRVLVVLDNAAGHDQIRPLLPGAPACLTLVTSRRRLAGLDDVRSHSLDVLSPADAARLLELAIGRDRSTDDLTELVRLCGHLPIAIQLVGNRLRHRPKLSATDLAKRLARDNRRLAEIRAEDREITVAFDLSYRGLAPPVREAFRRLGLHLGSDFTDHSAAAAIGGSLADADRMLDELLDHHLVTEPAGGRFQFHNLIRDYARQLAEREDSEVERRHTVQRQLDHYVSTALLADRLSYPLERSVGGGLLYPPSDPPPIETADQARIWMTAEYQNLLTVADYAASRNSPTHVALIAHGMARYLETWGHWDKAADLHERAIAAWRKLADTPGEAQALLDLSLVRFRTGQYAEALAHARESLTLYRSAADQRGEAEAIDHIGLISWQQSRYREALSHAREALEIRRSLGDRRGEARTLDHIAIVLEFIGRYQEAALQRRTALEIYAEIDDPEGLQMSLNNMGDLALRLGQVDTASTYYEDAAAVLPEISRQHEAILLNNMARIKQHTGQYDAALNGFRGALHTYQEIGDRRNQIETLIEIGATYQCMGRHGEALIHLQKADASSREISEVYEQAKALRRIGETLLSSGRFAAAMDRFQEAKRLADVIGEPFERAKAIEGMGAIFLRTRGRSHARRYWKRALRFYDRAGMSPEAQAVRTLLESTANGTVAGAD
jgi:DNA-binding SARP family transcriptional activator